MSGYTKLFGSILDSSIWRESKETRLVWITMLAMADKNGVVEAALPGLADRAKVSIEECSKALETFTAPDKWSRSTEFEGRRIEAVDGGWQLLNHSKYRAKLNADERRIYKAKKQAEYRQRDRLNGENVAEPEDEIAEARRARIASKIGREERAAEEARRKFNPEHKQPDKWPVEPEIKTTSPGL